MSGAKDSPLKTHLSAIPAGNTLRKVGIFSGTFDPVHVGHVEFALAAISTCGLERVVFLPEAKPRQKSPSSIEHRLAMLQLAVSKHANLSVASMGHSNFTPAQTLPELQKNYPNSELLLLTGSDIVKTFSYRWPGVDLLLKTMCLVVGMRSEDDPGVVAAQLDLLYENHQLEPNYILLSSPRQHLASTAVRSRSHSMTDLDPLVAAYIKKHRLYV